MKTKLFIFLGLLMIPIIASSQKRKKKTTKPEITVMDSTFHGLKWRNIGPFRGGRSVTSSGVVGQPMTYYFGSTGGGIWKTTDDGINWKNISDGFLKTGSVGAIAVSERNPNIVVAGMGEHAARGVMTSMGDGDINLQMQGKPGITSDLTEQDIFQTLLFIQPIPISSLFRLRGLNMAPLKKEGYTVQLMEDLRGKEYCISMIEQVHLLYQWI